MRLFAILFVAMCFTSFADARPFRRASCSGGNCNVAQPVAVPVAKDAKPFSPLDLTMKTTAQPVAASLAVQSGCVGGQCAVPSASRVRLFRR